MRRQIFTARELAIWSALSLLLILSLSLILTPAWGDETWRDPSFKFSGLRKVFLLPVSADLRTVDSDVMPRSRQVGDLEDWSVSGLQSAMKKNKPIVKSYNGLLKDMAFIYGEGTGAEDVYKRAVDMGYQAAVELVVTQEFKVEHVPERTWTRTVYKDVDVFDKRGRKTGSIRIPEEVTEVSPAHDVDYLSTRCLARLYDMADPHGEHKAAVSRSVYREYQGGPVLKVVENVVKAAMKELVK